VKPSVLRMLHSVRVRKVAEVWPCSTRKAEPLEAVREAVIRQQLDRAAAAGELVDRRGVGTPFFCGSLPVATAAQTASAEVGCSVGQMADGAGVENPSEVRQPSFGGGARDQIERRGVESQSR